MKSLAVFLCLGFVFVSSASVLNTKEWTKLILTHHWPPTFCSMEKCHSNISYWALHGLWPDSGNECNSSWHFNASLIEDLMPEMKTYWPDLLKPNSTIFWKHEWLKHGTCAAKAEVLNSQHKYFSKALELYHKLDLDGVLKKSNILPSEDPYKFADVEQSIVNAYGVKPKIQCISHDKEAEVQTMGQIEVCFDKQFQLIDCEKRMEELQNNTGFMEGMDQTHLDSPLATNLLQYGKVPFKHKLLGPAWIMDLMPEMKTYWPDLLKPNSTIFWKHEWLKHGTCAAKAEVLNSQHKYFSKALELYHKLDLDGVLKKSNILPSEDPYKFADVEQSIVNAYGVKPKIQCISHDKEAEVQTMGQIEVCFDKQFQLIDCEKRMEELQNNTGFMVCDESVPVYYPPTASTRLLQKFL